MTDHDADNLLTEALMRPARHPAEINLLKLAAILIVVLWVCSCYAAWLSHWFSNLPSKG